MESINLFFIVPLVFGFIVAGIRTVSQQTVAIVETFGKFSTTLSPGLNFIFYPFQQVAATVDLRVTEVKHTIEIKTEDNMFALLPVSLMIHVSTDGAADAHYQLRTPHVQIASWVLNSVRAVTAGMSLTQLFEERDHIIQQVEEELAEKLLSFGYVLDAVLIEQPSLSAEVQSSFNRVVAAKRECEAATQEGEAVRIKMVKEAEAEAQAQRERAEGLRDARKILAEGFRDSIRSLEENGIEIGAALDLLLATNRIDAIREAGKGGNLVLVDLDGKQKDPVALATLARVA